MNTLKELVIKIQTEQKQETAGIEVHNIIAAVLRESFDGKRITRRLVTKVQERMPQGATVYWDEIAGMVNLKVRGYPGMHEYGYSALIGYDSQPTNPKLLGAYISDYHAPAFEQTDVCHGIAAIERNKARGALLADTAKLRTLAAAVDKVRAGWAVLDGIEYGTPEHQAQFIVQRMTGLTRERSR